MFAQQTKAQTKAAVVPLYPESDGKPMAETDTHANLLMNLRLSLDNYFRDDSNVYVSGNLLVYYVEGNPAKCFAPDVFVVRGVPKGERRIYKLWEEGVAPQIIIELTSRKTWKEDLQTKWRLYEELGVQEYFIFDPEYDYLDDPLVGYRLENGKYVELEIKDGRAKSEVLGLELVNTGETLRLFDPNSNQVLPTPQEAQERVSELEATLARYREQFGDLPKEK
ncbi:MAG: Uma2 family endonuclease [Acidobacteriota bacterium]|nr:Uma2 family endonuclease [Acidobacteriota bacterium]